MIAVAFYSLHGVLPAWFYVFGLLGTFAGVAAAFPEYGTPRLRWFVAIVLLTLGLVSVGFAAPRRADFYLGDGCRYVSGVLYYLTGCWL